MVEFFQQLINGVSLGSVYALLALGVTLVWGVLDVLNFAHAQFMTWGTFATVLFLNRGYPVVPSMLSAWRWRPSWRWSSRRSSSVRCAGDPTTCSPRWWRRSASASSCRPSLKIRTDGELKPVPRAGFPTGTIAVGRADHPQAADPGARHHLVMMVVLGVWLARTRQRPRAARGRLLPRDQRAPRDQSLVGRS